MKFIIKIFSSTVLTKSYSHNIVLLFLDCSFFNKFFYLLKHLEVYTEALRNKLPNLMLLNTYQHLFCLKTVVVYIPFKAIVYHYIFNKESFFCSSDEYSKLFRILETILLSLKKMNNQPYLRSPPWFTASLTKNLLLRIVFCCSCIVFLPIPYRPFFHYRTLQSG
jgi:hypothetical protein